MSGDRGPMAGPWTLLAVVPNIFAAWLLMAAMPDGSLHNSDILYAPAFFDDLWSGVDVTGWTITPAPYFFPDFLIYGSWDALFRLLDASTAERVDMCLRLTSGTFFLLNAVLFSSLLRKILRSSFAEGLFYWLVVSVFTLNVPVVSSLFLSAAVPTSHGGVVPIVLLFWVLWFSTGVRRYLIPFLLLPAIVSDAQMLPLAVLPALAVTLISFVRRWRWQQLFVDLLLVLPAWLAAERMIPRIRYGWVFIPFMSMKELLQNFLEAPTRLPVLEGFFTVPFLVSAALVLFALILFYRKGTADVSPVLHALSLSAVMGLMAAVAVHAGVTVRDPSPITERYFHFIVVLLLPFVAALLLQRATLVFTQVAGSPYAKAVPYVLACIPIFIALLRPAAFPVLTLYQRGEQSAVQREVVCLYALRPASKESLYGISDYWHAKRLSLFGGPTIRLLPVKPDQPIELYYWITNLSWFAAEGIPYRMAIVNGLRPERVEAALGRPERRIECAGLQIWWYGVDSPIQHRPEDIRRFARAIGSPWSAVRSMPQIPSR